MENFLQAVHMAFFLILLAFRPTRGQAIMNYETWREYTVPVFNPVMRRRIQWRTARWAVPFITMVVEGASVCSGCGWVDFRTKMSAGFHKSYCQNERYTHAYNLLITAMSQNDVLPLHEANFLDSLIEEIERKLPAKANE